MDFILSAKQTRKPGHPINLTRWALAAFLTLAAIRGEARINVVTLPGRDSVQLTIYNSVDLTLVKETRVLTFRQGLNRLEFSWANTLIDPSSVEFRALTHADEVDVLDVSFPPRVTNTLEWRVRSDYAGEVPVEIRYFTSGISWAADYVAEVDQVEKSMTLAGQVRVSNHSGEDYENAQVRLVVGVIRLVEDIAQLARQQGERGGLLKGAVMSTEAMPMSVNGPVRLAFAAADRRAGEKPREIIKEGLSEYFLYTVEGRDTIPDGWSKRLPSFKTPNVPVISYYKFERERWGDQVVRFYRLTNSLPSNLGKEPLPDGEVKAFRSMTPDHLFAFAGRSSVKYIPIDETVEMELGSDQEVMVKPTLMNWEKTRLQFGPNGDVIGWTVKETWQMEAQNSKEIAATLDLRRNLSGDWSITTDAPYEKLDANKLKFVLPLKPHEKRLFTYQVTTNFGTNVAH